MTQLQVRNTIRRIETELEVLRRAFDREPDFDIDERSWEKIRPTLKRIRRANYRKVYG